MNLKKYVKKLTDPYWIARNKYVNYFDKLPINDKMILLESEHGRKINGNIFYILKYLVTSEQYQDFKIYLSAWGKADADKFTTFLKDRGYETVKTVVVASDEYFRVLASAKFLFNDTSFTPSFIKKEGQIYVNTWHGTPIKTLGRRVANDIFFSNIQKNFLDADYLTYPNEYTRKHIIADYMLENIATNSKTVLCGYPRNEIFFDLDHAKEIRKNEDLNEKKIYAYMPTFRGVARNANTSRNDAYLLYYLCELDKMLQEDEILYTNLHPLAKKNINFDEFQHIRSFPEEYETYEFLNAVDVLITDYSSVFFDFACTRKKIILFPYDKELYLADRGLYFDMDCLPFPQVFDLEQLLQELRTEKQYDDTAFLEKFCSFESIEASALLCDFVILKQRNGLVAEEIANNGKENVFFYAGNLAKNGITVSLSSLLWSLDLSKRNYYITFLPERVRKNSAQLNTFPEEVSFYAMPDGVHLNIFDRIVRKLYSKKMIKASLYVKLLGNRFVQNHRRMYSSNIKIDTLIQFNGYEEDIILQYCKFENNKMIFVHSDMLHEIKMKGNQRKDVLNYAYRNYDAVVAVTDMMIPSIYQISGKKDNIYLSKNAINYKDIIAKSRMPIELNADSSCSMEEEQFMEKLNSSVPKFINIGRFSPEKGHARLIDAFQTILCEQPDALLIIMGGYSNYGFYQETLDRIVEEGLSDNIILLLNISNPYPILNACDYFVLSSFYEGFGLVLAEADILGKPVISTDIDGPRTFMNQHGGTLVENSLDGLCKGMQAMLHGEIQPMNVDYEQYNQECVDEFEKLLNISKR